LFIGIFATMVPALDLLEGHAVTYIGNGPNFMVKSIAESSGARCPSVFGYIFKYSLPILLVMFAVVSMLILK
jgi:Na+/H+ antiporter NhaD/arsenite permease-like protein